MFVLNFIHACVATFSFHHAWAWITSKNLLLLWGAFISLKRINTADRGRGQDVIRVVRQIIREVLCWKWKVCFILHLIRVDSSVSLPGYHFILDILVYKFVLEGFSTTSFDGSRKFASPCPTHASKYERLNTIGALFHYVTVLFIENVGILEVAMFSIWSFTNLALAER